MTSTFFQQRILLLYPDLGAPTRYRVHHQIEQMRILGIDIRAAEVTQSLPKAIAPAFTLLYLYRLPWSWQLDRLVRFAQKNNVPVVFDTDDYVWDSHILQNCFLDRYYTSTEISELLDERNRFRSLISRVNALIVSTPYLAQLAQAVFCQPVFTNENAVSWEMVQLSEVAQKQHRPDKDWCTLGYFCGHANVHEADFELILPVLNSILLTYPHTRLQLLGDLGPNLSKFDTTVRQRVLLSPKVQWQQLPHKIACVDINLAPLVANPYTRSKSAVKFLEAALISVPTVASNLEPYQDIVEGQTGFLATTAKDWLTALTLLIENPDRRHEIGEAARRYVLQHHTTSQRAANFRDILKICKALPANSLCFQRLTVEPEIIQHTLRMLPRQLYRAIMPLSMRLKLRTDRHKLIDRLRTSKLWSTK